MRLSKYIILIGAFLILILAVGCKPQISGTKLQEPAQQANQAQQGQQSQPQYEPTSPVPPPPQYIEVTNDTPKATLEQECGKKSWPEFCTWIPEPDGRELCERCKELQSE